MTTIYSVHNGGDVQYFARRWEAFAEAKRLAKFVSDRFTVDVEKCELVQLSARELACVLLNGKWCAKAELILQVRGEEKPEEIVF